ncbi:MAG: efflux RND transporter periplasmic adaptor subunit [Verrucomicrobiota bacterium]
MSLISPWAVILLMGVSGCGRGGSDVGEGAGAVPVAVARPIQDTVALTDIFTGRFEAVESVEVRARVSGYLDAVHFDEGQKVEEGQLMFEIDSRPFDVVFEQRAAAVKQAEAQRELAESTLERSQAAAQNAISRQELAVRESELAQAEADLLVAQAARDEAKLDQSFAKIEAPISGIAGRFLVTPGNFITGGNASATLLTTIVPHNPIYCYFEVDERRVLRFTRLFFEGKAAGREGDRGTVEIAVTDSPDFEFEGTIDFTENRLDEKTATMQLRALVENPDKFLTPGLFARVRIPAGPAEEVVLVRDSALGFDQAKRFAWVVVEGNVVQRRFVEVGRLHGMLRIVDKGLTPDDVIAVSGIQILRPGVEVAPTEVPMDMAAALEEEAEAVDAGEAPEAGE